MIYFNSNSAAVLCQAPLSWQHAVDPDRCPVWEGSGLTLQLSGSRTEPATSVVSACGCFQCSNRDAGQLSV